jgi:hypothetical protein
VGWTVFIWIRIEISGGLLGTQQLSFGFHNILGTSRVAAELVASQEGFDSIVVVSYYLMITP